MAEEIIKNSESSQEGAGTGTEFDPVAAINDIKANTVPKEYGGIFCRRNRTSLLLNRHRNRTSCH